MFNNVWFYVLLYVVIGALAVITNAKAYTKVHRKVEDMDWGALLEFEEKALFRCNSIRLAYSLIAIAYVLWPVFMVVSTVKRTIAYRKVMKDKLDEEEWLKKFEEIEKKWTAQ